MNAALDPVSLAQALIRVPSITPEDHGCQEVLIRVLEPLGFRVHRVSSGGVDNFYARLGTGGANLCLAGHTDVVTPGELDQWSVPPFAAEIRDGSLVGRGVCDMKGGLACMVAAVGRFLAARPGFAAEGNGSLSFLVTGDEEGEALHGTVKVLEWLRQREERLDYCIVGEPTCRTVLGDALKVGRRGSLNGRILIRGVQGHVAYPNLTDNPIHRALPTLHALASLELDRGNAFFEPSRLQLTNLNSGNGSTNVVPGTLHATFNIRFNTEQTPAGLETRLRQVLDASGVDYTLELALSGLPFLTRRGALLEAVSAAVTQVTGVVPEPSTSGGTSDARFIVHDCPEILELGLVGRGSHKVDESAPVAELEALTQVYGRALELLFPVAG